MGGLSQVGYVGSRSGAQGVYGFEAGGSQRRVGSRQQAGEGAENGRGQRCERVEHWGPVLGGGHGDDDQGADGGAEDANHHPSRSPETHQPTFQDYDSSGTDFRDSFTRGNAASGEVSGGVSHSSDSETRADRHLLLASLAEPLPGLVLLSSRVARMVRINAAMTWRCSFFGGEPLAHDVHPAGRRATPCSSLPLPEAKRWSLAGRHNIKILAGGQKRISTQE